MKPHLHDWLPWSDPIATFNTGHKAQWRVCAVCNKAQKRVLFWDYQCGVDQIVKALNDVRATVKKSPPITGKADVCPQE